jgi:zinc transporter 1
MPIRLASTQSLVAVADSFAQIKGVIAVHELHIWRLNQQKSLASAHIVVEKDALSSFTDIANTINECLHAYGIHSATLQPEVVSAGLLNVEHSDGSKGDIHKEELRERFKSCMIGCQANAEPLSCCD